MSTAQMTDLSPAAQAIENAYFNADGFGYRNALAAALRAAADQVVEENYTSFTGHLEWDQGMEARHDSIREEILAIATELEGN
jgi:hypothetical protein